MNRFVWLELIGFDNTQPDFGVQAYLDTCSFVPTGVSLLFTWLEFPLGHRGVTEEYLLDPCECSYGAHPFTEQRARQQWTNLQLKRLIEVLHSHGIAVYLSYFNMAAYGDEHRKTVSGPFCASHAYLFETRRNGTCTGTVHMLKRLQNGSYFEDLLQQKTVEVLVDYGFDGVQLADGISSGRLSLQEGDYSDDIVAQFLEDVQLSLPQDIPQKADGDSQQMLCRADWIWQHHRAEWITFHCRRWETFYRKFTDRLAAVGKRAVFNSAWGRDPFEAIYRFGIDYRHIATIGVDGCMVEDVAPGLAILSAEDNGYQMNDTQRRQLHYDFLAALLQNRAAMPAIQILSLSSIHDTMEQWGVLEHMPTSMTRTVLCNLAMRYWNGESFSPIVDAPWFCLADGITTEQWAFIRKNWKIGNLSATASPVGVTWVWSDALLDREIALFIEKRLPPAHFLLSQLLGAGAPLHAIVRTDHLDGFVGDLLVPHPGLLSADEQTILADYDRGRVWFIGTPPSDASYCVCIKEQNNFGGILLGQYGVADTATKTVENPTVYTFDPQTSLEPLGCLWTHPLTYPPLSEAFFNTAATMLRAANDCPLVVRHEETSELITLQAGEHRFFVCVANDAYHYTQPTIDMGAGRFIRQIRCLTKYEGYAVRYTGGQFTCRVPGRGMEMFEVEVE